MKNKNKISWTIKGSLFLLSICAALFINIGLASAFGLSPAGIRQTNLLRGTSYETSILLSRSGSVGEVIIKPSIKVPEAGQWITVNGGDNIVLENGKKEVTSNIKINIPNDAALKTYKGKIILDSVPGKASGSASVGVSTGVEMSIEFTVVSSKDSSFEVRSVNPKDSMDSQELLVYLGIENTGNSDATVSKVTIDVLDNKDKILIKTLTNTNKIEEIPAYKASTVEAKFDIRGLDKGSYPVKISVFNGDKLVGAFDANITLLNKMVPSAETNKKSTTGIGKILSKNLIYVVAVVVLLVLILLLLLRAKASSRKKRKNKIRD